MILVEALAAAARAKQLLVASDFDGTLAPIVLRPELAVGDPRALGALARLALLQDTHVAVISGRALTDLEQLVGRPPGVLLIGTHGAEWGEAAASSAEQRAAISATRARLEQVARQHPGARIEAKPVAVAFHTRGMDASQAAAAAEAARRAGANLPGVTVLEGKEVVELTVSPETKGSALARLRRDLGADVAIFVGDDLTDETAFGVLGSCDVAVKVGPGPTVAPYRVADVAGVATLLQRLVDLRVDFLTVT